MGVKKTLVTLTLSLLLASEVAVGGAFNRGLEAYFSGDHQTALSEWEPLAKVGHAQAQYNLGLMYRRGQSVPHSDKMAVKWYTLAAHQGLAEAQLNLAHMLQFGRGVPIDYVRSYMWCSLSAYNGHKLSATYTADMAALMTYAELTKAQNMSSHCLRNNYIDC